MTENPLDNLESRLRDVTSWTTATPHLWKKALAAELRPPHRGSPILSFDLIAFARRRWFPLTACASAACLAFILFVSTHAGSSPFIFPSVEAKTETLKSVVTPFAAGEQSSAAVVARLSKHSLTPKRLNSPLRTDEVPSASPPSDLNVDGFPNATVLAELNGISGETNPATTPSPVSATRHVIHKATIELTTPDVRAAFLRAGLILNEGLGEHVQDSSLTGTGNNATGTLTLRVVASRLSKALNDLRELGVVVSERQEGQDVTAQVVDVEARLRNEQRVEKELLELFDQRKDAPLKDVLDLRQKLSEVRAGIEQLVAQRDQLSRLVSLATVLVIIRTGEKPPEAPKDEGLSHYFGEVIKRAWQSGTRGLADTIAALLSILIGGLIWWILLIVALLLLRRYVRARSAKS